MTPATTRTRLRWSAHRRQARLLLLRHTALAIRQTPVICQQCMQPRLLFAIGKTDYVGVAHQVVVGDDQFVLRLDQIFFQPALAIRHGLHLLFTTIQIECGNNAHARQHALHRL